VLVPDHPDTLTTRHLVAYEQGAIGKYAAASAAPIKNIDMLDEFNVPKTEHQELLGLLLPMRDEIVEVESPETGTPLPGRLPGLPGCTVS
jgi:hypothetical protein